MKYKMVFCTNATEKAIIGYFMTHKIKPGIYAKSKRIHKKYGLGDDNVHYNKEGYERLARYIYRFLRKEL